MICNGPLDNSRSLVSFLSPQQFSSWLCLCPDNDTSASRVLRRATRKNGNRLRGALRTAASTLHHNKSVLGDKYRRLRARLGAPKAITAVAHQLARIIWHLLTHQVPYERTVAEFVPNQRLGWHSQHLDGSGIRSYHAWLDCQRKGELLADFTKLQKADDQLFRLR